jgi:hypothetical protein
MTQFLPEWKLTVNGVDLTDATIARISHRAGRTNIYSQPTASSLNIKLIALTDNTYSININDGVALQVKDSTGTYKTLFGGNITDLAVSVESSGSVGKVYSYSIIALGSLAKLVKTITSGVLTSDYDGDQIYALLTEFLLGDWNGVSAAQTWADYDATATWATAENLGLGSIDRPGQYEMVNRADNADTVYNIASLIANSGFGYLYEDSSGNIGYADANHRQDYIAANGATEISANTAIGAGIQTTTRSGDIRNDITLNYGNNFNDTESLTDADSVEVYGYKSEVINSTIKQAADAELIVQRYIDLRAYPYANFESITFPITNPEMDDTDRDALLGIFIGQPITITDLPPQIASGGVFEGYVEGWSWSTSFNQLFLTINLSPIEFSAVFQAWNEVNASEAWNTLSSIITWQNAIGVIA